MLLYLIRHMKYNCIIIHLDETENYLKWPKKDWEWYTQSSRGFLCFSFFHASFNFFFSSKTYKSQMPNLT